jgi:hypothetical protein
VAVRRKKVTEQEKKGNLTYGCEQFIISLLIWSRANLHRIKQPVKQQKRQCGAIARGISAANKI